MDSSHSSHDWKCLFHRHWLGLYHTFEAGCFPGDRIDDTPAEAVSYAGCNPSEQRDTCPGDGNLDPIHNYMDYSDDICLYDWTPGQIQVMHANIEFYRSQRRPVFNPVRLVNDTWSKNYTMARYFVREFYIDAPNTSTVFCDTSAVGGDIELFMNWDGSLVSFDCASYEDGSYEACNIGPKTGRARALIWTKETTVDFQVRCSLYETN